MHERSTKLLLQDIVDAGNKIIKYTRGASFENFQQEEQLIDPVVRNFEIIGKASKRVALEVKGQFENID